MSTARLEKIAAAGLVALLFAGTGVAAVAAPSGAQTTTAAKPASQAALNQNMQEMRTQMKQLDATHDPAAQTKLLDAHMRTMQKTLHMMKGQGSMGGAGGMGTGMMHGKGMGGSSDMMANGQMMQMMMGQMMQHQQAMQAMGCTK